MKALRYFSVMLLCLAVLLCSVACAKEVDPERLWQSATYKEDATIGSGAHVAAVRIEVGENSVTLTVRSDKESLGEALYENGIIDDPVYFGVCNGMKIDQRRSNSFWGFYIDGAMGMTGVGDALLSDGEAHEYKIALTSVSDMQL